MESTQIGGHERRSRWGLETWGTLAALALVLVGTTFRLTFALRHSNAPFIDENEVVEQGVAFMGPDLRFYFPKYAAIADRGTASPG